MTRFQMEVIVATGTVKFFNGQKGYGFIVQDQGGPDVFVHVSAVERAGMRSLNEGQKLSFDIEADRRRGKSAATNLQASNRSLYKRRALICRCSGRDGESGCRLRAHAFLYDILMQAHGIYRDRTRPWRGPCPKRRKHCNGSIREAYRYDRDCLIGIHGHMLYRDLCRYGAYRHCTAPCADARRHDLPGPA